MDVATDPILAAAQSLLHRGDDGGEPVTRNGVGFNRFDWPYVADLLRQVNGDGLSRRQALSLIRVLGRYQRQLAELGVNLSALAQHAHSLPDTAVQPATTTAVVDFNRYFGDDAEPTGATRSNTTGPDMAAVLGQGGVIAASLPGYEPRPQQIQMAQAVADAIASEASILAEAGCGVGKSVAYLVPAIMSGKKTIVSTESKILQDQLSRKDLPYLKAVLEQPFTFAVVKGIANYLCLPAWDREAFMQQGIGKSHEFAVMEAWLNETETGDLADAPVMPSPQLRQNITVTSDACLGKDCQYAARCFALKAKAAADRAQIVVANHALLALDLAVRAKTDDKAAVLPDRELVIVDECHQLDPAASTAFTVEVTNSTVQSALQGHLVTLAKLPAETVQRANQHSDEFFRLLGYGQASAQYRQSSPIAPTPQLGLAAENVATTLRGLADHASRARTEMLSDSASQSRSELELYSKRLRDLADRFLALSCDPDGDEVLYVEREWSQRGRERLILKSAPVSVADDLRSALWNKWPVVATSATITAPGTHGQRTFEFFRTQTGCRDAREISVDSPFDFRRNALIYMPADGRAFDPRKGDSVEYFDRLGGEIEALLLASDGRAFCLFTSRKALDEVYGRIAHRLRWSVYRQGDAAPARLIEQFRADGHGVLFGLRSFWSGIDVVGDALSLIIVDKTPFPNPSEPIYQARSAALNRTTGDQWASFRQLAIPMATIQLAQGVGRLIRSKTDRGVIALLDGGMSTKSYSVTILRSLPPAGQTRSLDVVRQFFASEQP